MLRAFQTAAAVLFIVTLVAAMAGGSTRAFAATGSKFATILIDARTGETMYARHADSTRYPASLTKVMTLYLTFDALADGRLKMTDTVVMSPRAAAQPPSKAGLRSGDRLTVEEAIDLLIVKSANDVAVALAEKLATTETKFAAKMTARARRLGMKNTRFANASGLPDSRQISTARDLAILAAAVQQDFPQYYPLFNQQRTRFRGRTIQGHNRLLGMPGVDGMKTGYTRASGFNLLTSAERNERRVIAVVLGGSSSATRDAYMRGLLTAAFQKIEAGDTDASMTVAELLDVKSPGGSHIKREFAQGSSESDAKAGAWEGVPRSEGEWLIQVGAFSSRKRGANLFKELTRRHPRLLGRAEQRLEPAGDLHLARYGGFSERTAGVACKRLMSQGQECLVLQSGS